MSTPAWQRPLLIIRGGFRSCAHYWHAWRELRQLPRRRADCESRLAAACTEIGTAAGDSLTESDLPEFTALRDAGGRVDQASQTLAEKLTAWQSTHSGSGEEIAAAGAELSQAGETARAAAAAAAAAQSTHQAVQSRLAAMDAERTQTQSRLDALPALTDSGEPSEEWQSRVTAGEAAEKERGTGVSAAQQSEREAAAAATAAGTAAEKAARSWDSTRTKLQKSLDHALGSVAPDRDNIILAARAELDAATLRNEDAIANAQAHHRSLVDAAGAAHSRRAALETDLTEIRAKLTEARTILASRTLRARLAELDAQKPEALTVLEAAAAAAAEENAISQSAAATLQRAQAAADDAKNRGLAAVTAAKAAHEEANAAAVAAAGALQSARLQLGRALFDRRIKPASADDAFARAEACTAELAQLEADTTARRGEMQTARGPALKTVLGAFAVLCALGAGIYFLTRSGSKTPPPAKTTAASAAPANATPVLPPPVPQTPAGPPP